VLAVVVAALGGVLLFLATRNEGVPRYLEGRWRDRDGAVLPDGTDRGKDLALGVRVVQGPEHCAWESVTFIQVAWPPGSVATFLEHPQGELRNFVRALMSSSGSQTVSPASLRQPHASSHDGGALTRPICRSRAPEFCTARLAGRRALGSGIRSRSRECHEFGVLARVFAGAWAVNGLLLAGVARKGQDAELATSCPSVRGCQYVLHRFLWTCAGGGAMLSAGRGAEREFV
jgi:hypothetical protein